MFPPLKSAKGCNTSAENENIPTLRRNKPIVNNHQMDSAFLFLVFQTEAFGCQEKGFQREKKNLLLTAKPWFPFKYPLLDSAHYTIVPSFICHSNQGFCPILIPLSVAGEPNSFLPMGLMSFLPFRNRTKLAKRSWNREHYKPWLWALLTCRLAEAYRLSSFFIFITSSCVLAFVKASIWTLATLPIY